MTVAESALNRELRILAGLATMSPMVIGRESLWGLIGVVPLATGLVRNGQTCSVFGFRACSVDTPRV